MTHPSEPPGDGNRADDASPGTAAGRRAPSVRSKAAAWAREIAIVVLAVLVIQVGLVQAFHVPSSSMESTLLPGEWLFVDKLTLGPRTPDWLGVPWTEIGRPVRALKLPGFRAVRAGDVVVVRTPMDPHVPYVKRVVAVGGEAVEVRDKRLYVDGRERDGWAGVRHADARSARRGERTPGIAPWLGNRDNWGPYRVPDGHVFLMGDNRDDSVDSRWFGPVPEDRVIGLARMIYFSWDGRPAVAGPLARLRWRRLGTVVR